MESDLLNGGKESLGGLFVTSTKWFDFVINLSLPKSSKEKNSDMKKNDKHRLEIADWSLVKILQNKYEEAFGHAAIFFADENCGKIIGVKLKPVAELKGIQAQLTKCGIFDNFKGSNNVRVCVMSHDCIYVCASKNSKFDFYYKSSRI